MAWTGCPRRRWRCRQRDVAVSALGWPGPHALVVMALTLIALYLFSRDRLPIETSSLIVVAILAILFSLFPYESDGEALEPVAFFAGFGNEALITICALVIASQGLVVTGALTPLGQLVSRIWRVSPTLAMGAVLLMVI